MMLHTSTGTKMNKHLELAYHEEEDTSIDSHFALTRIADP